MNICEFPFIVVDAVSEEREHFVFPLPFPLYTRCRDKDVVVSDRPFHNFREISEFCVVQERRLTDFEALKL